MQLVSVREEAERMHFNGLYYTHTRKHKIYKFSKALRTRFYCTPQTHTHKDRTHTLFLFGAQCLCILARCNLSTVSTQKIFSSTTQQQQKNHRTHIMYFFFYILFSICA